MASGVSGMARALAPVRARVKREAIRPGSLPPSRDYGMVGDMVHAILCTGLTAALFSSAAFAPGSQPSGTGLEATQRPSVLIPAGAQPSQAELDD